MNGCGSGLVAEAEGMPDLSVGEVASRSGVAVSALHFYEKQGLKVEVTGLKDGIPTVAGRRTPVAGPGTYLFTDMAAATGTACAAFMVVALEADSRAGVFTPEEWAEPQQFYAALERVGVPRAELPSGSH